MTEKERQKDEIQDIPHQILEKFIAELKNGNAPLDVIKRLEQLDLEQAIPSEQTIRTALFPDINI